MRFSSSVFGLMRSMSINLTGAALHDSQRPPKTGAGVAQPDPFFPLNSSDVNCLRNLFAVC